MKSSISRVLYIEQVDLLSEFNAIVSPQKIPFIINSGSETLDKQLSRIDQRKVKSLAVQGLISIPTSTTTSTTMSPNTMHSQLNHLSVGSRTFFAVITERRQLRIYWPRQDDEIEEEQIAEEQIGGDTIMAEK